MIDPVVTSRRFVRRFRGLSALLLLALLLLLPSAPASLGAPRVQPELLATVAAHPQARVGVIVQKLAHDDSVEALVARLGGSVTKDLHIINAFVADLPASALDELSRAPGVRWISPDAPVDSSATNSVFTTWATQLGTATSTTFASADAVVDSAFGPNGTFGSGAAVRGAFGGFAAEVTPGNAIVKVEIALHAYVPSALDSTELLLLKAYVGGLPTTSVLLDHSIFNGSVGAANASTIYVDITGARLWRWADFDNNLEIVVDQSWVRHSISYDAIGLRVTSSPGVDRTGGTGLFVPPKASIDTSRLVSAYDRTVRATDVWNEQPAYLQGQGMAVAVVDSGIIRNRDLAKRVIASVNRNAAYHDTVDRYGHGTFVAGIIDGDGTHSLGKYIGIAPKANLVNVRVSDDQGMTTESDVVGALQWIYDNRTKYNIRVVNLSLNSSVAQSYNVDPLDAAVEILWFNNVVVVVSAGNNGSATLFPPANDPFVITVGATNDMGTASLADDIVAPFSAYGTTESGFAKPELVAPGTNIVAYLPENSRVTVGKNHSENRVNNDYFRMSGTSMAAPMVSGAVALLLQDEPALTPDQVKYRLIAAANKSWAGYNAATAGAGYLDIYAAIHGTTTASANTGILQSKLLWANGNSPQAWDSATWGSATWGSATWGSATWGSATWGSDYWGQ